MGFKRNRQFRLKFADEEYAGFECLVRSMSMSDFLDFTEVSQGVTEDKSKSSKANRLMVELLAKYIVSWNLEDEKGKPVPPTLASILAEDMDFILAIFTAWIEATAGVNPNLQKTSSAGNSSLEASMSMENL